VGSDILATPKAGFPRKAFREGFNGRYGSWLMILIYA
jgi:hypothetical protein